MLELLHLHNERLRAEIVPQAGGGLARLDWLGGGVPRPLLRPLDPGTDGLPPASQLACFPLVPWSNRMEPGGFVFEGRRHTPAPNRAGEPCPIHGDGWQQSWRVARRGPQQVLLELDRGGAAPFAYAASLRYRLDGDALVIELTVRNSGALALPFGLGLHPWMPDPAGARLRASAAMAWLSGPDKLPRSRVGLPPQWDFGQAAALPPDGVDNAFDGWDGVARIEWPARGLALRIEADMAHFILYVPPGRDFFCFEPVDHPINAHNMPGRPGLTVLAPGAVLRRRCIFRGEAS